ncbi:MAG: hypothetical protein LAP21_27315 [Acidobacteriia bacterium]|nr:hypothetical protein [Terriglobia bacterium]
MAIILIVVLIAFLGLWALQAAEKQTSQAKQVAFAATRHVPAFLRERTGLGPWFEMDDFFRQTFVDIKCTRCELDTIFVCNATGETEFIDLHYAKEKLTILHKDQVLFNGRPLDLMSYPEESYFIRPDRPGPPPPKESRAYRLYAEYMKHKESGTLEKWLKQRYSSDFS